MKKFTISSDPDPYPKNWPPEAYVAYQQDVKRHQLDGLMQLLEHGDSETQIDEYLKKILKLWHVFLFNSAMVTMHLGLFPSRLLDHHNQRLFQV